VKVSMTWGMGVSVLAFLAAGCSQPKTVERTPVACAPAAQPEAAKAASTPAPAVTAAPEKSAAIAKSETKPAAAPEVPSRSAKTASTSSKSLSVKRLVVATGMDHREPQGVATLFRQHEVDKLYAYVEVENDAKSTEQITVSFEPPDGRAARGNITLDVGSSPRWRTWAYTKNALDVGSWTAVVKDASGRTLARQPFEIAL
jgi:hypothetical protein